MGIKETKGIGTINKEVGDNLNKTTPKDSTNLNKDGINLNKGTTKLTTKGLRKGITKTKTITKVVPLHKDQTHTKLHIKGPTTQIPFN